MQKVEHYDLTYLISKELVGFSLRDTVKIAWSNYFVDMCKDYKKFGIRTMVDIAWNTKDCFIPEVQKSVFACFHFIPGGKDYVVRPHSDLCNWIVQEAIESRCLISIGIALHSAIQDAVSHETFSGFQNIVNAMDDWNLTTIVTPRIGHAEFLTVPDKMESTWERNGVTMVNAERFKDAAYDTYEILCRVKGIQPDRAAFDIYLEPFWKIKCYDKRKQWIKDKCGYPYSNYKYITSDMQDRYGKIFASAAKKQQAIVQDWMAGI